MTEGQAQSAEVPKPIEQSKEAPESKPLPPLEHSKNKPTVIITEEEGIKNIIVKEPEGEKPEQSKAKHVPEATQAAPKVE